MNNKGWGLSSLLGFLAIFGIFILISTVLYNNNFANINTEVEEAEKEQEQIEVEEAVQEEQKENSNQTVTYDSYQKLENILKSSAIEYIQKNKITSEYKTIITYDDINQEDLINDFIDPRTDNECRGYVIYDNNEIKPFVRCTSNYQTENYNEELE